MKIDKRAALEPPKIISQSATESPAEGQCDACSPIMFAQNQIDYPTEKNKIFQEYPKLIKQPITSNYHAVVSPLTEAFSLLNQSALTYLRHFQSPKNLDSIPLEWSEYWGKEIISETFTQMLKLGLLIPEGFTKPDFVEVPTSLTAWLHITDRCNLRCAYCYLPHQKVDMSLETGRAAIDATIRSALAHQYREVKFKYAGGEPLLKFDFVKELHQYARSQAEKHHLKLDGVVLSNGTRLTPEIIKTMQLLGLRLMISLDGLGEYQNQQRSYANGRGTAADVTNAIDLALQYGLVPDISITVTARNAKGLPEVIAWILERELPFSLNFYRENELSASHQDLKLEEEKIIEGILAAYKVIETNLPRRSLLASLVDRANLSAARLRTCSVGHSYLVFDYLGQVSKCQMQIDKPVANIQSADPLAMVRADKTGIQNIPVNEKEGCHSCEWKYWCTGGCPLATFRATGRYDVKSPDCNIYKALYPEVLRLEGLRLLKYTSREVV